MLRDAVKLGLVTVVGLGVVATVGVGAGVVALVAGAIVAGVSSAEPPRNETTGTPKVQEKKLPKQEIPTLPHASGQEKRPSETTKKQTSQPTNDMSLQSKAGRSPESKNLAPNSRDERKATIPTPTNVEPKSDRAPQNRYIAPNGRDERKVTPTPNRKRSSSVVVNKPGDATTSPKEDVPRVGSSNGTASPGDKPSSLSRELEAQVAPEVEHWRNEKPSKQETRKRGTPSGRGIIEKPSSPALAAKAKTVPEAELTARVNVPGPLPLLPPSPIPKPKSTPHPDEVIVESQPKPETTVADPPKEEKHTPSQNGISREEPPLSTPEDHSPALASSKLDKSPPLQAVAQDSRSGVPLPESRHPDASLPSTPPVVSAPVEESADLAADAILAATASTLLLKLEPDPLEMFSTPTAMAANSVVPNGTTVLQGPASASRDSLVSVQRRNSKLASAAKKVKHSVKKVFRSSDGKIIHSDSQRLTSSSSDSVDSQRFTAEPEQTLLNGGEFSKLASSSRESIASTKSRRSLIDGTKKGFKRMFRGSSDNIGVPPVPPLPSLSSTATVPEAAISSEKPATPAPTKPAKGFSSKNAFPGQQHQQAHASVSNSPQSTRSAPGIPDAGNNASPLLKGMFKGRTNIRVRR